MKFKYLLGMFMGIGFFTLTFIQYYALHPDLDKLIAYSLLGFLLFGLFWAMNNLDRLKEEVEKLKAVVDAVEVNIMERREDDTRN